MNQGSQTASLILLILPLILIGFMLWTTRRRHKTCLLYTSDAADDTR